MNEKFLMRLKKLEDALIGKVITCKTEDGEVIKLKSSDLLRLLCDQTQGRQSSELEKILQVVESDEGGEMISLIKAIGAGPVRR